MFNWADFHKLALQLEASAPTSGLPEAAYRSCVSRLYYGAFRTALRFAEAKGYPRRHANTDHSALRRHLREKGKHLIAEDLADLQIWREQCDYDDIVQNLSAMVTEAKRAADRVHRVIGNG